MRVLVLYGHSKPITCVKFNEDGDLLFSSSKDNIATVWFAETGKRMGTFEGHKGVIWWMDVTRNSKYLVTGGGDMTVRVWNVEDGKLLHNVSTSGSVKHVEWSESNTMFLCVTDPFNHAPASVKIFKFSPEFQNKDLEALYSWEIPDLGRDNKITKATWMPLDKKIITTDTAGVIRVHEVETGHIILKKEEHEKGINTICWNKQKYFLLTGSFDCTAKLWDIENWTVLKTFETNRPVYAVGFSPLKEHVFVSGGQEAELVASTSSKIGGFGTKIFHEVLGDHIGTISLHYSSVSCLNVHPQGIGFSSGSIDGYVRIYTFDSSYYILNTEYDDLEAFANSSEAIENE